MNLQKLLIALTIIMSSPFAMARGDGTWPLRLGGGTWPLRLAGESLSMQEPRARAVATSLTIRNIDESPLRPNQSRDLQCTRSGERFQASGQVHIGNTTFRIKGICYFEETDSIEVISETTRQLGRQSVTAASRMIGQVPASEDQSGQLSGRLHVDENATESGRYMFNLSK